MELTALEYLRKVVRIRKALVHQGANRKPMPVVIANLTPVDEWLKFWGKNCTEDGALKILYKFKDNLAELIPGGTTGCGPALRQQLKDFINQYEKQHERAEIQTP